MSDKDALFALWLERQLNAAEQQQFDQLVAEDKELAERVATARHIRQAADEYRPQFVPSWQPQAIAHQQQLSQPWRGWLPLSFATSMLAIVMVLLQVEIQWHEQGMMISFAGKGREQEITSQVASRLADFEQKQQQQLADYVSELEQSQQQANMQLANYLLSSSRTERREDFAELIKYVNEQRSDDQLYIARQLNEIQQQVYETAMPPGQEPGSVNE
ncbi:hypothetical protein [Lacimicrobium alkaliphilum]|uniref:Uncharacterized protein n=1 Tax=Lacimicrobium alkaliphilum TaxID=1526571 RepID=A0A0U2Z8Y5_9ALTE|nr:hypothetical protein [Lacimicrobium alkaliphilum]ALS99379.1 hypothetical protein AT746_14680 [Lacimicrobium alkaliphilum]